MIPAKSPSPPCILHVLPDPVCPKVYIYISAICYIHNDIQSLIEFNILIYRNSYHNHLYKY